MMILPIDKSVVDWSNAKVRWATPARRANDGFGTAKGAKSDFEDKKMTWVKLW